MNRLSLEDNRSFRRIYLNVLVRFGNDCVHHAVSRLNDSRWFVVRNMLYLLRELGDQTTLPHIRLCMKHPNSKVSLEALKTCLFFHDKEAVPFLLSMLKSENEEELLHAVSLATLFDNPAIFDILAAMLLDSGVLNFHLELKKAIIRCLATTSPNKVLPIFATLLNAHNIFHGKQLEALKLEIISVLEKMPGEESHKLLFSQRNSDSATVVKAAKSALEKYGVGKI
jgi:HEAT repeat protein